MITASIHDLVVPDLLSLGPLYCKSWQYCELGPKARSLERFFEAAHPADKIAWPVALHVYTHDYLGIEPESTVYYEEILQAANERNIQHVPFEVARIGNSDFYYDLNCRQLLILTNPVVDESDQRPYGLWQQVIKRNNKELGLLTFDVQVESMKGSDIKLLGLAPENPSRK